jgi:hypothetical protein
MKLYDYERIYLAARGDPSLILKLFFEGKTADGHSFIVNESVLKNQFVSEQLRAEYLGLCSLRKYSDYKNNNTVDLQLDRVPPWIPMQVIRQNPFITTTSTQILFNKER